MGIDYDRGSLIFVVMAFQLHLIGMALTGSSFTLCDPSGDCSLNDAVTAFFVIAYLLFLVTFILCMIMNFMGELKGNKGVTIACIVMCLAAALSSIMAIIMYAAGNDDFNNNGKAKATGMTTFFTAGSCGIIAGVFLILTLCGCG